MLIPEHHPGFIDWQTYEANQQRIARNTGPDRTRSGGAVREGGALLQGLARCGHCGRRLHTHYRGRNASPGYHCPGKVLVEGRGVYCLNIGGVQIDEAVARAFLAALEPAGLAATLAAAERLESDREAALKQWRLGVERASYEANAPSAAIAPSIPTIGWWRAASNANGRSACGRSMPPRPSSRAASKSGRG